MVGSSSDFVAHGKAFFDYVVTHAAADSTSAILDVGCGLGKTAVHFATFLNSPGCYEGFDVEKESIDWCRKAITSRFPLIRFKHIPLSSAMYNEKGQAPASKLRFPYRSSSFDIVFLASVFTHMFDDEVENYLREISRVLKPGGRCIATFYLLNEEKRSGIVAQTSAFTFAIPFRGSSIERSSPPEAAVAHEEVRIRTLCSAAGLVEAEPPRYGAWAVSKIQDQDFLMLRKP